MRSIDNIENIFYINLSHRTDRQDHIKNVIKNIGFFPDRVRRIEAFHTPENGSLGCARSHIFALEEFLKTSTDNCLILEDDFNYYEIETFYKLFSKFFDSNIDWDLIQLSSNTLKSEVTDYEFLTKIIESQTTSGYFVKKSFANKLLDCFRESKTNLENGWILEWCIDQNWKKLQPNNLWYCFNPKLGYQLDGYSDIEKKDVNYKC